MNVALWRDAEGRVAWSRCRPSSGGGQLDESWREVERLLEGVDGQATVYLQVQMYNDRDGRGTATVYLYLCWYQIINKVLAGGVRDLAMGSSPGSQLMHDGTLRCIFSETSAARL